MGGNTVTGMFHYLRLYESINSIFIKTLDFCFCHLCNALAYTARGLNLGNALAYTARGLSGRYRVESNQGDCNFLRSNMIYFTIHTVSKDNVNVY